jgi:hypothetical protein
MESLETFLEFQRGESFVSEEEKRAEQYYALIEKVVGPDLAHKYEGDIDGMFHATFSVEEAIDEIKHLESH